MSFDIHQLDDIDGYSAEGEEALFEYQDALIDLFHESPEGQNHRKKDPDIGFWAAQLVYYGYGYVGATIPQMTVEDVEEIVTDLFPRKISLFSPEEAQSTIPELCAFWQYLKREYRVPNADVILNYLQSINPAEFVRIMFDPERFGMAKSFFMAGQAAGFDMTDADEMNAFMHLHNAAMMDQSGSRSGARSGTSRRKKRDEAKEKRKRKAAKKARRRGRRKKRK